jgi:hypothetical protein
VPYLGFSDAVATSASSIKANIAVVRNAVFPVELIPIKQLLVSVAGLFISLAILLVLIAPTSLFGWHVLYLPVSLVLLLLFTAGVVWLVAATAALVPDVTYLVNLLLSFFLFISPIGYSVSQVPRGALFWGGDQPDDLPRRELQVRPARRARHASLGGWRVRRGQPDLHRRRGDRVPPADADLQRL